MRTVIHQNRGFRPASGGTATWVPIALMLVAVPWGAWSFVTLQSAGTSSLVPFEAAAGWFVILAAVYFGLHGLEHMAWSSAPVLLTAEAIVVFVGVPAMRFMKDDDQIDAGYAHAMFLVLIGFVAFWIGSLLLMKKLELRFEPIDRSTPVRITYAGMGMFALGLIGKAMMWKMGLFSYTADAGLREASQGIIQWLALIANLLNAALVVSAIEVFGKKTREPLIRIVFLLSLTFSLIFGVISGMKSELIFPLLYVLIVYGIVNRRMPRISILLPVILVVLIYPFVQAYRDNLGSGYSAQVNTVNGLESTLTKSFDEAFLTVGSRSLVAEQSNSNDASSRLSYLSYVRSIIELPSPSLLNGDEKIWMAPLYPLIPRILWKSKPIQNKGERLARALGSPGGSAASTPIGDLYSLYGTRGVVIGMLIYGMCLQLYMNRIQGSLSEKGLFIYVSMLIVLLSFESDAVGTISGVIQTLLIVLVISSVIYGRTSAPSPALSGQVR